MYSNTSAGVFDAFNYNFDSSKFGSAQYLPEQSILFLQSTPPPLANWAVQDLADLGGNLIVSTDYYQNPVGEAALALAAKSWNMANVANTTTFSTTSGAEIASKAYSLTLSAMLFKMHTDNVSGVTPVTYLPNAYPSLSTSQQVGTELLRVLYQTDGIQNSVPMLGCMTSLFIGNDLVRYQTAVEDDESLLVNSIISGGEAGNTSNLSESQANSIISDLDSALAYMDERRLADWDFYRKAYNTVFNSYQLQGLSNPGNTLTYLVNNVIGTPSYKAKLAQQKAEEANT